MPPSEQSQYTPLPTASSADLPAESGSTRHHYEQACEGDQDLDLRVYGPEHLADETDGDAAEGRKGLLSGREKEQDSDDTDGPDSRTGSAQRKHPRRCFTIRTLFLSSLFVLVLVLVAGLFHPSSPYSRYGSSLLSASKDVYYGGADLAAGVYDSSRAAAAPNPLPSDAVFADIPFAKVGGSKDKSGKVPVWAGGDWGEAQAEKERVGGPGMRWNGTHWFEPTVIMISLDGVKPEYLEQGLTPKLLDISRRGMRAEFMRPSFPTLTFPNHWTLLTGLYPSAHGVVANDYFDPAQDKEFLYTEPGKSWDPAWWGGEPIWATAIKNQLRSAVLMWPGPPRLQDGIAPTLWYPFVDHFHWRKKATRVASWLDMPYSQRPQVMTVYAPEVDQAGHGFGPDSNEVKSELRKMDAFVGEVFDQIDQRNLTDVVDVIVVSDHGMAATSDERLIFLDDILGSDGFAAVTHSEGWPSVGLRFAEGTDEAEMLSRLQATASKPGSGFQCYTPETMPERWHYTGNDRIAPIYCVPDVGWSITDHHDYEVKMQGTYKVKGNHGYDNADPAMNAIFVAHGPFAKSVQAQQRRSLSGGRRDAIASNPHTTVIPGFDNIEVYDLIAGLLRIPEERRAPTNGTRGFWEKWIDFGLDA